MSDTFTSGPGSTTRLGPTTRVVAEGFGEDIGEKLSKAGRRDEEGRYVLPEHTYGWQVARLISAHMAAPDGSRSPMKMSHDQLRALLWLFAVEDLEIIEITQEQIDAERAEQEKARADFEERLPTLGATA